MIKRIFRRLLNTQRSQLTVINIDGSRRRVVYETRDWIEAPNWSPDGKWLVFNNAGKLFRISAEESEMGSIPAMINTGDVQDITNDHVISSDGENIFFTAQGRIYAAAFSGGMPRMISQESSTQYYIHGVSPDGSRLSCTGYTPDRANGTLAIYLISAAEGAAHRITNTTTPVDGAEFSPDGQWIYFNGELHATEPGHSQIFRMHTDGSDIQQLTFDSRVNWFPHISPDGQTIVYLSYVQHTQGHPANRDVVLRRMPIAGGEPVDVVTLFGGQGTINTNSWAPDSKRFAYVGFTR